MADNLHFYAPIEKADEEQHMVYGYASTEALDSQGEVVSKAALSGAIDDYMKFANIREMHQPSAVGKTKKAQIDNKGMYIAAKIVDEQAWQKVKEGVYSGFSIGGRVEKQVGNEITGLKLSEISLVDRPANPEAIIDVFKAEMPEIKEEAVGEKEVKKSLWQADYLVDLACNLSGYIMGEAYEGQDISSLKAALQTIKQAAITELNESEQYPELAEAVEMAEKAIDLQKGKTKEERAEEAKEAEEKEENEEVVEEKPLVEQPKEPEETPEVAQPKEAEVTPEVVQPKEPEKSEKSEMEKIEEGLKAGKMPTDEQCGFLIKEMGEEVNERTLSVLKYSLAGKILEYIQVEHEAIVNKDVAEAEAKKAQDARKDITETRKHEFDNIKVLVNKLEKAMNEQAMNMHTADAAPALPSSEENPVSPAEKLNQVLAMLQEVAASLSTQNQGNGLSPKDRKNGEDGYREGSSGNNGGNVDPNAVVATPAKAQGTDTVAVLPGKGKADMPDMQKAELEKMESELTLLKEEIKKLADQPMPVKAYAGYMTVEKFEKSNADNKKIELEKAEKRADELQELMKTDNSITVLKEAEELSKTILQLRREVHPL